MRSTATASGMKTKMKGGCGYNIIVITRDSRKLSIFYACKMEWRERISLSFCFCFCLSHKFYINSVIYFKPTFYFVRLLFEWMLLFIIRNFLSYFYRNFLAYFCFSFIQRMNDVITLFLLIYWISLYVRTYFSCMCVRSLFYLPFFPSYLPMCFFLFIWLGFFLSFLKRHLMTTITFIP